MHFASRDEWLQGEVVCKSKIKAETPDNGEDTAVGPPVQAVPPQPEVDLLQTLVQQEQQMAAMVKQMKKLNSKIESDMLNKKTSSSMNSSGSAVERQLRGCMDRQRRALDHGMPLQDLTGEPAKAATPGAKTAGIILFNLEDGYHYLGIDPDFQKFTQFDVLGTLYQCTALPFSWNDSLRLFVKFMRLLVECGECLQTSEASRDRAEIQCPRSGAVRQRWEVQRRAGGAALGGAGPRGTRVLPYMDDHLPLASSTEEAYELQDRVERILNRPGLRRNEIRGVTA
ncbi:hypothetical protein CYMTET_48651 [Cymbomonas tetramitiformis]|uniref:Uncharacterized protein n=1 Tax=Cymbomonas tetramitiformis TaxID=36881 RepID=A0AAE0BTK1_9CHLO|nr:hypothetical protein CYMTET_48651 [Cymbomonas tetramitiformis]